MVPSLAPDASADPSGEKASAVTTVEWSWKSSMVRTSTAAGYPVGPGSRYPDSTPPRSPADEHRVDRRRPGHRREAVRAGGEVRPGVAVPGPLPPPHRLGPHRRADARHVGNAPRRPRT